MAGTKRHRRGRSRRNGRRSPDRVIAELCELGPFSVFCALHLGITERDGFAEPNAARVARRFELTEDELESYLRQHELTADDLRASNFDLDAARLDIQVAPEGISRVELARTMFAEVHDRS